MQHLYSRGLSALLAALSALLVADLFLTWRDVRVGAAGVTIVSTGVSGWNGWGIVIGIAALGLLVYALLELAGFVTPAQGPELGAAALGIVIVLATIARFDTVVHVGTTMTSVSVDRRWPATVGVALAVAIAVVTIARLVVRGPAFGEHGRPAALGR